ncbi:hypothetical protein [Micromonospora auratinigra]|uniref:hypothetical protein n=1 Tax=Micromonospora auratinigra TaxID=261654 RepID=UPI0012FDAC48|nr:hypothetical protein [Micromonospora auratinigra]
MSDLGDQLVAVVDAEGGVGDFGGEGAAGVGDADVDALTGNDQGSSAADAAFDLERLGRGLRWRSGGLAVVGEELAQMRRGEAGRDGLESDAVDEQVNDGGVDPEGDRKSGAGGAEPELLPAAVSSPEAGTRRPTP